MATFVPKRPSHPEVLRSGDYADILMELADSVKAKSIIEGGLGAAISGLAFVESMSKRAPAVLRTVEVTRSTELNTNNFEYAKQRGVAWQVIYDDMQSVNLTGSCDILYIDCVCSTIGILNVFHNLGSLVRSGGLIIVDGVGEHMVKQGFEDHAIGTQKIAEELGVKMSTRMYRENCGFGIVVKP